MRTPIVYGNWHQVVSLLDACRQAVTSHPPKKYLGYAANLQSVWRTELTVGPLALASISEERRLREQSRYKSSEAGKRSRAG